MGEAEGDQLTAEAYTEVAGVAGAIEKTAENAYNRLSPAKQDAARRLFLRPSRPAKERGIRVRAASFPMTHNNATSSISSPIPRPAFW
jgi:hypothetical protein